MIGATSLAKVGAPAAADDAVWAATLGENEARVRATTPAVSTSTRFMQPPCGIRAKPPDFSLFWRRRGAGRQRVHDGGDVEAAHGTGLDEQAFHDDGMVPVLGQVELADADE